MKISSPHFFLLLCVSVAFSCSKTPAEDPPRQDDPLAGYEDLSADGTANCYIVSKPGDYMFRASVKGNGHESVGSPDCAELLWESLGTGTAPEPNSIVKNVGYCEGYITFSTPKELVNGNALIAVKDGDEILWSWHVWVCGGYDSEHRAQKYPNNVGYVMDRNLGATSADMENPGVYGLLYQWGRKDPFMGLADFQTGKLAASTGTWEYVAVGEETGTIDYAVKHPMSFIFNGKMPYDWLTTADCRLWGQDGSKTIYDPCPRGWRVPEGGSEGFWPTAFGTEDDASVFIWSMNNDYIKFDLDTTPPETAVFPNTGSFDGSDQIFYSDIAYYWTSCSEPNSSIVYAMAFWVDSKNETSFRANVVCAREMAQAVRCVSE